MIQRGIAIKGNCSPYHLCRLVKLIFPPDPREEEAHAAY
jgi:hypothetical protein